MERMETTNDMNMTNNGTVKSGDGDEDDYTLRNIIVIAFYSLIVCVSLCGNLLVLRIVFGKPKMITTTNILIGCLAFSDCLTTTLNIPFNVSRFLLYNWPFGSTFCILVPFVQVCCVYVSTLTMAVIAIHRWLSVGRRSAGSKSLSCFQLVIIIITTWTLAALLAIPHSIFNRVLEIEYKNVSYTRCRVVYPKIHFGYHSESNHTIDDTTSHNSTQTKSEFDFPFWLSIEALLTQYLIPLSITCILYIKIGFIVSKQGQMAGQSNDERRKIQSDARRRRIIMLFLVVVVFAACWFPLNLYHLLVDFKLMRPNFNVFLICHWIAMSSVCYNPFIYCWLNESFRKGAVKLFKIICWCCFQRSQLKNRSELESSDENNHIEANQNQTNLKEIQNSIKGRKTLLPPTPTTTETTQV